MALGASASRVARLFLWSTTRHVIAGIGLGLGGAVAVGTAMSGLLVRTSITDPSVLTGISLLLVGVALAAVLAPLARLVRVDPAAALRHD
jgi:ABC-type antimicrobial peptide transport system permease subunit